MKKMYTIFLTLVLTACGSDGSNGADGAVGPRGFDLETGEVVGVTTAGTIYENMNTTWVISAHKLNGF